MPDRSAESGRPGICDDCWEKHDPYWHVDFDVLYARDEPKAWCERCDDWTYTDPCTAHIDGSPGGIVDPSEPETTNNG